MPALQADVPRGATMSAETVTLLGFIEQVVAQMDAHPGAPVQQAKVRELLEVVTAFLVNENHSATQRIASALLRELPPDKAVITYLDGHGPWTASQLLQDLEEGGATGKQFVSDLFRVARDILQRQ